MPDLSSIVAETFASYYEEVRDQVHELVAPLSTEQLWRNPYPYGNSIGHLLLHLTGNLSHYIGARIAGTGYVRNRPLEFTDPSGGPKEEVVANFDRAIDMVAATIRKQSPGDWLAPYSDPTLPDDHNRFSVIQRMAAHAYHHVGQMIYLAKELSRRRVPHPLRELVQVPRAAGAQRRCTANAISSTAGVHSTASAEIRST